MKRVYAFILTIAIVFSISFAPAHAAVSSTVIIEGVLSGLIASSLNQAANTFWGWATASAEEKHNALRDANDSWYNLSKAQIVQYSVNVSADDLYSMALELNRLGFPCRIASANFDGLGYGSVGTLWYIQGTGQMIDKYGNLLGTLSYDGESFATNINGKNFGDGMSRVGLSASPPRVFVARFDYSSAYLDSQLSVMNSILSSLGTTNNLLASINNGIANLSGVSSGGGGGGSFSFPFVASAAGDVYQQSYFCPVSKFVAEQLCFYLNSFYSSQPFNFFNAAGVGSTVYLSYAAVSGDYIYLYDLNGYSYVLCSRWNVRPYKITSDVVGDLYETLLSMDGRLQNISTELVALDAEIVALGVLAADIDLGVNSLVASNAGIKLAVDSLVTAVVTPVEGTNALLLRILNNIKDVEDLVDSSLSISDDLITEIDTNWIDNLDAFRDDIVYNLYLFEGVYSMPNVTFSRDDIVDYFEGWCSPDA